MIESVFDVQPVAAREKSSDVGNLLEVLGSSYDTDVPKLPEPGYVIPSSLCLSSINPSGGTRLPLAVAPLTNDEEPTVFLKMIESGMLAGFPGY